MQDREKQSLNENNREELHKRKRNKLKKSKLVYRTIIAILTVLLIASLSSIVIIIMLYEDMNRKAKEASVKINLLEEEIEKTEGEFSEYLSKEEAAALASEAADNRANEYLTFIKGTFESGGGTLTVLEELYPNLIIAPDTSGYKFFEINRELNMRDWTPEGFTYPVKNEETNEMEGDVEYDDGKLKIRRGVDVSTFQGEVNWNKVKADGIDFAYMRLGYRGYQEGNIFLDAQYENNISGCNEAGIDCGVYFFTEAVNEEEAEEEADYCIENLEGYDIQLPIVIDVEVSANQAKSRTKNMTSEQRTKNVLAFCERVRKAGYEPMVYGNLKSMLIMMDYDKLEGIDKWFAYYRTPLRFPYKIKMWQYTSTGKVDGIKGDADINIMFY